MDGTLIEPLMDFARLRSDLGIGPEVGIIEALDAMEPADAEAGHRVLTEHELHAARNAQLLPHAAETLAAIAAAGLKTALLTRNSAEAMGIVMDRFSLAFDLAWSRENGPIKPEPDGILRACERLGIAPAATACVGDFKFDMIAANAAGAVAVLFAPAGPSDFAGLAQHVIARLDELPPLLGI